MFNRRSFGGKRTSDSSELQKKLAEQMLEILLQLPEGKWNLKDSVVDELGEHGELPSRREIDAAWETVKKKASKSYSRKFTLDRRKGLIWIDDPANTPRVVLDKRISRSIVKKLNDLARQEGCTVDQMIEKLILAYEASGSQRE